MTKTVPLEFHPASDPPDDDTTVLCTDGDEVFTGWKDGDVWFDCTAKPVQVTAWAHLPEPGECVLI